MTSAINNMTKHLNASSTSMISQTASAPGIFVLQLFQGAIAKSLELGDLQDVLTEFEASPDVRVSLDVYIDYFKRLREQLGDELLGMFPQPVPLGVYRALCHGLIHMKTVQQCFEHMNYLYGLFNNNQNPFELDIDGDRVRVVVAPQPLPKQAQAFFQQSMLLTPIKTLAWLTGAPIPIEKLSLTHESYGYGSDLQLVYGCTIEFEQPECFVEFSVDVMQRPIISRETEFDDFVRKSFEHIIKQDYGNPFINAYIFRERVVFSGAGSYQIKLPTLLAK